MEPHAWFLALGLMTVAVLGVIRLRKDTGRRGGRAAVAAPVEERAQTVEAGGLEIEPALTIEEMDEVPPEPSCPLRILLAEDNSVNQKVALLLLERLGYKADLAANGVEVLAALRRQDYDVILMDVQMPEMDGLETARRIAADPPRGARPHIIAITANVLRTDRDACLAAGMEDYLSKPILLEDLRAALARTERPCADAPSGEPDRVLDPVHLERLLELQRLSGSEVVPLIVNSFVKEGPRRLERMRGALARGDRQELMLVAHTLKGGSAQLGALRVAAASHELEENCTQGRLDGAGEILDRLECELAAASAALLARSGLQESRETSEYPPRAGS